MPALTPDAIRTATEALSRLTDYLRESPDPEVEPGGASMSFVKRGVGFWVRRRCRRGASRTAR